MEGVVTLFSMCSNIPLVISLPSAIHSGVTPAALSWVTTSVVCALTSLVSVLIASEVDIPAISLAQLTGIRWLPGSARVQL